MTTLSWIRRPSSVPLRAAATSFGRFGDEELAWLPRYQSFSDAVATLIEQGGDVREIAGNDHVALTWITPRGFRFDPADGEVTLRWPLLTDSAHERVLMFTPVAGLSGCLPRMTKRGAKLDHIFDY